MATLRKMRKSRKKSSKKRSGNGQNVDVREGVMMPLASLPLLVPDRIRLRFRYTAEKVFTTAFISQPGVQVWSALSLYDPDVSGVGGVCAGIAAWTGLYAFGCVLRSRCKVRFINQATTPIEVALVPGGRQVTNADNTNDLEEQPWAKLAVLGSSAGGHDIATLETEIATYQILGVAPLDVLGQRQYWTTLNTANPAVNTFWNTSMFSLASSPLNVYQVTSITYDVVLLQKVIDA